MSKEDLPAPVDNASWPLGNVMGSMSASMGVMKQCQCAAPTVRRLRIDLPAQTEVAPGPPANVMGSLIAQMGAMKAH